MTNHRRALAARLEHLRCYLLQNSDNRMSGPFLQEDIRRANYDPATTFVLLADVLAAVQALPPAAERTAVRDLIAQWRKGDPDFIGPISSTRQATLNKCADQLEKACADELAAAEATLAALTAKKET